MKKISTLFKKDPNDLGRVINEIDPENSWVLTDGIPTRKFDGTACAIINNELYKRYDIKLFKKKKGKIIYFTTDQIKEKTPKNAIPCQEADKISGHHPHWVKCDRNNPSDKYFFEAFGRMVTPDKSKINRTYELCGYKINGNPEGLMNLMLIPHGVHLLKITDFSFESVKKYLSDPENNIEGIVFHHKSDDRMCKIRKSDFGIKR